MKLARVGPQLGLVRPHVPPRRDRLLDVLGRGLGPAKRADEVRGQHGQHLADAAVLHQVAGPVVDGHRALLRADLRDALELAGRADHRPAFGDGQGDRLLDVGVHAGLHGEDRDPGAGVRGGFDHHGVELLLLDHLAEVGIGAHGLPPESSFTYCSAFSTWQSQAATTWNALTSAPSRINRERPPQPITPTRHGFAGRAAPVQAQGTARDEGRNGRRRGACAKKVSTSPTGSVCHGLPH